MPLSHQPENGNSTYLLCCQCSKLNLLVYEHTLSSSEGLFNARKNPSYEVGHTGDRVGWEQLFCEHSPDPFAAGTSSSVFHM